MKKIFEFIMGIYLKVLVDTEEQPLFCGFPEDPTKKGYWAPKTMQDGKLPKVINKSNNNYFSLATYRKNSEGKFRAKKENIVAVHAILLDDIGTKVKKKLPLKPSWKIESSPDNNQCGLIFKKPCTDLKLYDAVVKALGDLGYTDKGAAGATRYARLEGVNTKKKYLVNGVAPKVKLVYYYPERRYSLKQIIKTFRLESNISRNANKKASGATDNSEDHPVVLKLKAQGLYKAEIEPGKHDITCPWVSQHTEQVDHGTVYFEPSPDNKHMGGFKCQHGHCSSRTLLDLSNYLGITEQKEAKKGQVELALELVQDLKLFKDQNGNPYCFLDGNCLPLRSGDVRNFISHKIYQETHKSLSRNNLGEVLSTLEGKALFASDSLEITLHLRIASYKERFWYDLGTGKAVRIGPKGWSLRDAPMLFRRYDHQSVQVTPVTGGDAWKIFYFLNVPVKHQLETRVVIISYLIPDIAHPVISAYGPKGSAKTTSFRFIKRVIDPSTLELISTFRDIKEVLRQLTRHHMPVFDNVSHLSSELSDIFCTACTGGGYSKRTFYTDDDDCIYTFKRCIAINGINLAITKPDLLDRTMLLHFDMIRKEQRKEESVLFNEFEAAKPAILGGMFDILSRAMRIYPQVNLEHLPRLADFARWGFAIAEAIEKGKGKQFIKDYQKNIRRQNSEVLQNNSLCLAVTRFMDNQNEWSDTVQKAFDALVKIAEPDKTDKSFPATSNNLRKHLELIQSTLIESEGIDFKFSDIRRNDGYHVTFKKSKG